MLAMREMNLVEVSQGEGIPCTVYLRSFLLASNFFECGLSIEIEHSANLVSVLQKRDDFKLRPELEHIRFHVL